MVLFPPPFSCAPQIHLYLSCHYHIKNKLVKDQTDRLNEASLKILAILLSPRGSREKYQNIYFGKESASLLHTCRCLSKSVFMGTLHYVQELCRAHTKETVLHF